MVKKSSFILIAILGALVAGFALLHPGLIPTHDGEYHIVRFYQFNKAFLGGDLYPRWAADLNNGYGVPLFNFVYPLPNYLAVFLHALGASFIDSFKIGMLLSFILGAVFFYLWSREFWGNLGALVSSIFYTFSPYHILDVYIRGSVGEALALAVFPAFLWSITKYIKTDKKIFFPLSALIFALLIFSHNILALMFSGFSIFYVGLLIFFEKDNKQIASIIKIFVLGLAASSIFWLPALAETKFTVGLQVYDVESNFSFLYQLLMPSWGSGFSTSDLGSQMSLQIGLANIFVVFLTFIFLIFKRFKEKFKWIVLFFLFWFALVLFLMLNLSKFVWDTIPLMNFFQFPWRFLSLEIVICSFLAGSLAYKRKFGLLTATILIAMSVVLSLGYIKPAYYLQRDDHYYETRSNFIDGTNSPGNAFNTVWFDGTLKKKNEKFSFSRGSGVIKNIQIKNSSYLAKIETDQDAEITVNTAYFPGWNAYVDGKEAGVKGTPNGLFYFDLPKGTHEVMINLDGTYFRRLGELGSALGLITILLLFGKAIFGKIEK